MTVSFFGAEKMSRIFAVNQSLMSVGKRIRVEKKDYEKIHEKINK